MTDQSCEYTAWMLRLRSVLLWMLLVLGLGYAGVHLRLYSNERSFATYRFYVGVRAYDGAIAGLILTVIGGLAAATFLAAREHGGLRYALGYLVLVSLGSLLMFTGPLLGPLLLQQEIEAGTVHARRPSAGLRPMDWVAALAFLGVLLWLRSRS